MMAEKYILIRTAFCFACSADRIALHPSALFFSSAFSIVLCMEGMEMMFEFGSSLLGVSGGLWCNPFLLCLDVSTGLGNQREWNGDRTRYIGVLDFLGPISCALRCCMIMRVSVGRNKYSRETDESEKERICG